MNEPIRLTLIEQAEQKQCPACSSEDSLSLKDGHLTCHQCDDMVRDELGWLSATVEVMIDDADGQVSRIARVRELVEYLSAVADRFEEHGLPQLANQGIEPLTPTEGKK